MNRKKSYERMMRIDELQGQSSNQGRSEQLIALSSGKNRPRMNVIGGSNIKRQLNTLEV